jgi:hypothetical protein
MQEQYASHRMNETEVIRLRCSYSTYMTAPIGANPTDSVN